MAARIEDWLEQMRQAQEPGPVARVVVVRNARGTGWTFDLTEKTELAELADRIDTTLRDALCSRCEMRALDAEGRVIGNLPYDESQGSGVAQLVTARPAASMLVPFEDGMGAVTKSQRASLALHVRGVVANYEHGDQMFARQERQIAELYEILASERREHAADIAAVRKDHRAELAEERRENAELRKRVKDQWALEDPAARSEMIDKQVEAQKALTQNRMAESVMNTLMVKLTGGASSPAGQSALLDTTMKFFRSLTTEQLKTFFELLSNDQRVMFMEIVEQAQKVAQARGSAGAESTTHVNGVDAAVAAAATNTANSTTKQ